MYEGKKSFAEIVKTNKEIFGLLRGFIADPASLAHDSWLGHSETDAVVSVNLGKRSLRLAAQAKTAIGHLSPDSKIDFSDPRMRLGLLDSVTIERLLPFAGAALLHEELRKIPAGGRRERVKQEIGNELMDFALNEAHFLAGTIRVPHEKTFRGQSWKRYIAETGARSVGASIGKQEEGFLKRVEVRLHIGLCDVFRQGVAECGSWKTSTWHLLRKILIQKIDPQWATLFDPESF